MATNPTQPDMSETIDGRTHEYFAEATALLARLTIPIDQGIEPLGIVTLSPNGGYLTRRVPAYMLESVISIRSGYTQVAGHREPKADHGWATLTTAVVEGLNVLDVLTADRVVAQVSVDHPPKGYVPSVTFLGTRFENLRIAGHPVDLDLDLDLFGEKPANDAPYTRSEHFVSRVRKQHDCLRDDKTAKSNILPGVVGKALSELLSDHDQQPESFDNPQDATQTIPCSLVNKAQGSYPGHSCGHIITIPNFGTITLAEIGLIQSDYDPKTHIPKKTLIELTMINLKLGCLATGTAQVCTTRTNGIGKP